MKRCAQWFVLFAVAVAAAFCRAETPEEAFTRRVLPKFSSAVPKHKFEYGGPLEIHDTTSGAVLYLDRIYGYVSSNPTVADDAVARYVARFAQVVAGAEQPIQKEQLRLAVRNAASLQKTVAAMGAGPKVAYPHDLAGDLVVVPVIDTPTRVKYVGEKDLVALGLTEQQAEALGAKNLRQNQLPMAKVAETPPKSGIGIITEEYAASRLIFPSDWQSIQKQVGGSLIVMAPAYDTVIYGDGSTLIAIDALRTFGRQVAARSQVPLSPTILRLKGDHWEVVR